MHYSKLNLFIRSCIFWFCSVSIIGTLGLCSPFLFFFPLKSRYDFIYHFIDMYMFCLKHICHINIQIKGLEHIPKDRSGIIFSKHSSTLETFILPRYFYEASPIAKRELLWVPFFGWGLAAVDPILINRSNKTSAMQQILEKGKKQLKAGRWIMFFPEGTRVPYGTIGYYKLGGTRLAAATGAPILPVAHNAGRFWPRRKFIKKPGTVTIVLGPIIESVGRTPEELLEEAKTWIEDTITKL